MNQEHCFHVPPGGDKEPPASGFYPSVDPLPGSGGRRPGEPSLRDVALLCLMVGRLLLESGANGRVVHEAIATVATGLEKNDGKMFISDYLPSTGLIS